MSLAHLPSGGWQSPGYNVAARLENTRAALALVERQRVVPSPLPPTIKHDRATGQAQRLYEIELTLKDGAIWRLLFHSAMARHCRACKRVRATGMKTRSFAWDAACAGSRCVRRELAGTNPCDAWITLPPRPTHGPSAKSAR